MERNILITSVGRRVSLVEAFVKEFQGTGLVHGADMSPYAPALYFCDKSHLVPRITDPSYIGILLEICKKEHIHGILSLIDPELSLLGRYREAFAELGVTVIGSSEDESALWYDKYESALFLRRNGLPTPRTYLDLWVFAEAADRGKITFPVLLKPRFGSASLGIMEASSVSEVQKLWPDLKDYVIQEKIHGEEYGVDVYVDLLEGEISTFFIKKKLLMRAGETDKSLSVWDEDMEGLIRKLIEVSSLRGPVDVDILKRGDEIFILEVNPRFGGGYPHAYHCGVNFPEGIRRNLQGETSLGYNEGYEAGLLMMKYDQPLIVKERKE